MHRLGVRLGEAAFRVHLVRVQIHAAAVRVIDFLYSTGAVCLTGRVNDLETLASFCSVAVVEHRGHRVEILTTIAPEVDAAVCHYACRMIEPREPVHGVDLMNHPLIRNSGRVRPEQSELEVLSRVEWLVWPVDQEPLPVCVLFFQLRHQLRTPPTPGLIYIPGHIGHNDVAELARLYEIVSPHVTRS